MKKFRFFSVLLCAAAAAASLTLSGCAAKDAPAATGEELLQTSLPTEAATTAAPETTIPAETQAQAMPELSLEEDGYALTFGSAKSMLLYDVNRGSIVCSRAPDAQAAPGGLTKLVTALIVMENCSLEDGVTVGARENWNLPAGALNQNLQAGEEMTVRDLLACMLLEGANDAAIVLSEQVAGSQWNFVDLMNSRVKEIGCTDTAFSDVHGLDAEKNRTTARDMLRIIYEAIQNDTFRDFFSMTEYVVPATNCCEKRELMTHNYMMEQTNLFDFMDPRVTGGMQAYRRDTGGGLVCTVEDNGLYIGIVLGSERVMADNGWSVKHFGDYEDMTELLNQGIQN
ncbi:MAG: serine hydrolase [Eubacteriales bacterium]|nr:serine hydrolase [Eubacteriales bacterium]